MNATFTTLPDGTPLRIDWSQAPTTQQLNQASTIVQTFTALYVAQQQQTPSPGGALWQQLVGIVQTVFDLQTQLGLETIARISTGLSNRLAYIQKYFNWTGAYFQAWSAAVNVVNTAATAAAALAVQLGPTQTMTGSIAANGTITGLSSTAQTSPGMVVTGPGITGTATVATVPSGTSVTLTGGTYTAETSQSYTFTMPAAPNVTIPGALAITN